MRNHLLGTCSFLLLSGTAIASALSAQRPGPASPAVQAGRANPASCPVGFSARHASGGDMVSIRPGARPRAQTYAITFVPAGPRAIVSAKVTLHGLFGQHVIPVGNKPDAQASESFTLAPTPSGNHHFASLVSLGKLTGVTSAELNELAYADGTRWRESPASPCEVTPNGYLLVAAD